jgi:NAD(P)-dependent dehydrogenase (short-subunit alcohol dehydrogenase family)
MPGNVLVGGGGLVGLLQGRIPEEKWKLPVRQDSEHVSDYLVQTSADSEHYVVFTNVQCEWRRVAAAGWKVFWLGDGKPPVGVMGLGSHDAWTVLQFAEHFWNVQVNDRRTLSDVIGGHVRPLSPVLFVTGGSGGLGKTTSSKRLGERAGQLGLHAVVIDGNRDQGSLWSFFGAPDGVNTIADWHGGLLGDGANRGKDGVGVQHTVLGYDVVFAPPAGSDVTWGDYREFIRKAQSAWDLVVVDLDHVSPDDFTDPETAAGALLAPMVRGGGLVLMVVKAGMQTELDGLRALSAMHGVEMRRENIAIKVYADHVQIPDEGSYASRLNRYGVFMGVEQADETASVNLASGRSNWSDPNLDLVRERVLQWALPDAGFDPSKFEPEPDDRRGLFASLFGGRGKGRK